jgi:hypothetical protein
MSHCPGPTTATEANVEPGDAVLYFSLEWVRHAGTVEMVSPALIVRSKWGGNEVHRHKLWQLPAMHGDRVKFFRSPDRELIFARLEDQYGK